MKQLIQEKNISDTVLGVIYTDTNYIVSGSPNSLKTIMDDSISSGGKYVDAVRYPLHNPHHNNITGQMYEDVDKSLFIGDLSFNFPVIDLENGEDITKLGHKELL